MSTRFNKSLKVLNIAVNNGNKVELFTELDHSFVAGDIVWITGGFYDNSYATSFVATNNPFALQNVSGYKVLLVNYAQNSFTIDYSVSGSPVYPYGVITTNPLGDPQDAVNLAYNNYTSTDMYKDVFVSSANFKHGRFSNGIVFNGVFGSDMNTVNMNKKLTYITGADKTNVTVNHFCAKNVDITAGVIQSKTDSASPITVKISLDEPTGAVSSVAVGPNNDGWGYSRFEKIQIRTLTDIYNGEFLNTRLGYTVFNSNTIIKAKIGDGSISNGGLLLTDCSIGTGEINASSTITIGNDTTINAGTIDTAVKLNVLLSSSTPAGTGVTYGAGTGQFVMNVRYEDVANKLFPILGTATIQGITTVGFSDLIDYDKNLNDQTIRIDSVTYTYGTANSAEITFTYTTGPLTSGATWTAFQTAYPTTASDFFNFDNVKMFFNAKNNLRNLKADATLGNINITAQVTALNPDTAFIGSTTGAYSVNVIGGHHSLSYFSGPVKFNDGVTGFGNMCYLSDCYQYNNNVTAINDINYVYATRNSGNFDNKWKGNFTKSYIANGNFYESKFTDCNIVNDYGVTWPTLYLYYSSILGKTVVDPNVEWDYINFNPTIDTYNTLTYVKGGDFQGRKIPFTTGPNGLAGGTPLPASQLSLAANAYNMNVNRTGILFGSYYRSTVLNVPTVNNIGFYTTHKKSIIPTTAITPSTTDITYINYDYGELISLFPTVLSYPRNELVIADNMDLAKNLNLSTAITNKNTSNAAGTYDADLDNNLLSNVVDDNYVYQQSFFPKPPNAPFTTNALQTLAEAMVYESPAKPAGFPTNIIPMLQVEDSSLVVTTLTSYPVINNVGLDIFKLKMTYFTFDGGILTPPTKVPECFIEIEWVDVLTKSATNVPITQQFLPCGFSPVGYREDIQKTYPSSYPADFYVLAYPYVNGSTNITVRTVQGIFTRKLDVSVGVSITLYENGNRTGNKYRTTLRYLIEA